MFNDFGAVQLPGKESLVALPRGATEFLGGADAHPAGRLADKAEALADNHGCPSCPHTVKGPSVMGSPNVLINGRGALRQKDGGIHAACCGPNIWEALAGTPRVIINGRAAHRMGDATQHCGGVGKLTEGSPNVKFGGPSLSGLQLQTAVQVAKSQSGRRLG